MTIALWIVQGLLGLLFVVTGSFKAFQSREKVIASGGAWAEDFDPRIIRAIAMVELISGLLLIILPLVGYGRFSIIGAANIALIMTGAIYVHIRRKEYPHAAINLLFLLMALFVAYASRPM